jgi:hypothetical protein
VLVKPFSPNLNVCALVYSHKLPYLSAFSLVFGMDGPTLSAKRRDRNMDQLGLKTDVQYPHAVSHSIVLFCFEHRS